MKWITIHKKLTIIVLIGFFLVNITPLMVNGMTQDGKAELNKGLVNVEKLFEDPQMLAPSHIVKSKKITIQNTGDLPLHIYERFQFTLEKKGHSSHELKSMLEKYYIRATFYKNDDALNIEGISNKWLEASEYNKLFDNEKGKELTIVKPDEVIYMVLEVKLDENAANEYQGVWLNINYIAGGVASITNIAQDGLLLPNTATNIYNLFLIGLTLLIIGVVLFFNKKET
jgi:LPXTG-motif cell wall-anchored protein